MVKCRISDSEAQDVFSLGELYVSDFVSSDATRPAVKSDLTLCLSSKSKLLQLKDTFSAGSLYGRYWYRSGTNLSMRLALKDVVDSVLLRKRMDRNAVWLDIASNDGTLLRFVPGNLVRIGIDPAEDSFKEEALKYADDVVQDFFSADIFRRSTYGFRKADVVTVVAMFYDLDDPGKFLRDVSEIMDDDGLLVLQMSYTPLMIQQLAFDNICHEHICYYSLTSLKYLLEENGFQIVDCELNDVNGGSFRAYIKKDIADVKSFKTGPFRDVANFRIQSLLEYEEVNGFNTIERYEQFYKDIVELKKSTVEFILEEHGKGKVIWGYGASTKGNTLLQWYGLDHTVITAIAERSPYKHGLKTVGTNIPIESELDMRKEKPDYLLVLPWHFIEEFKNREEEYLKGGGAFIVPCPKFEVIRG